MAKLELEPLLAGLLGGPLFLGWGMISYKKKQLMDNTPTSKVRSASMGLVELTGRSLAWAGKEIRTPLTSQPCCWWRCTIEKWHSGKHSHWETLKVLSSPYPFYLQDETGRVLIDPSTAEIRAEESTFDCSRMLDQVRQLGVATSPGFLEFSLTLRATEEIIVENSKLYVLGEIMQREEQIRERRERFQERLRAVKKDPEKMAAADSNKDGVIDPSEWDEYRMKLEQEFLLEEENRSRNEDKIIIREPRNTDYPFLISVSGEHQTKSRYAVMAWLMIPGGIAGSAFGVWYGLVSGIPLQTMGVGWVVCTFAGIGLSFLFKNHLKKFRIRFFGGRL